MPATISRRADVRPAPIMTDYSLEITAKDAAELPRAAALVAPATRVSITFLPRESREKRLAAVAEVLRLGLRPVPHISARRLASETDLDDYLSALRALGACEEVFVVAGDPDRPDGPYADALAIIESGLLERHGVRHVGVGGYPEGHPKIPGDELDHALHAKAGALARRDIGMSVVTQFGFATDPVLRWLGDLRASGIHAPVRWGVPGPASAATLLRFAARCGVAASGSALSKYGLSLTRLMHPTGPDKYVRELVNGIEPAIHGNVGLHFYPFGGLENTARWVRDFAGSGACRPARAGRNSTSDSAGHNRNDGGKVDPSRSR